MTVSDTLRKHDLVRRTNHPNLVNLTGMSRTGDGLYFSHERPGASLKRLYALIRGGQYLQKGLKHTSTLSVDDWPECRSYMDWDISMKSSTFVMAISIVIPSTSMKQVKFKLASDCTIKISTITTNASAGDIGRSMLLGETDNFAWDLEAVHSIATTLLDFRSSLKFVSMSSLAADQFTKMPSDTSLQDLLEVRKVPKGHDHNEV